MSCFIYLIVEQPLTINEFCNVLVSRNARVIASIVYAYESISSILIKMEYLVTLTDTGEHQQMKLVYEYWDKEFLNFLILYVG